MSIPSPFACLHARHSRLLACALLLLCAASVATAKQEFTVQPPPAWVRAVAPVAAATTATQGGTRYLLYDRQMRESARGSEHYYHMVEQVASAADVEQASQLKLDFEPSYQHLVIHHIRVVRGGATLDVLRPSEIKIIQQESELDEQLFNGTLSAVVFLDDVRAGDVLDYAYSVNGANPVLAGDYADLLDMADDAPIAYLHTRLLWPASRHLHVRAFGADMHPSVTQRGAEVEYLWERRDVPAALSEGDAPAWFDATPTVQLSEFATWADVARWAAPLYNAGDKLSPPLRAQIERWRTELPTAEARLLAARRFVQDEVRYLGIELGPYSHTPTQPDKVFRRRFGDCKDKSLLLATMLNALGIEAHPALVNTKARHTLDDYQPSPFAFDHVIVEAALDNKTYWIDPTISYQRGTLANYYAPAYARALVLRPGANVLTEITPTQPAAPALSVHMLYAAADTSAPVTLTVTDTFRYAEADAMRYRLAGMSRADFARDELNFYADREPSIEAESQPEVADDEEANVLTVTEHYVIPRFWKRHAHYFMADRIAAELAKPEVSRRRTPLEVSYPTDFEQEIEMRLPAGQEVATGTETVEGAAFRFTADASTEAGVLRLRYTLRTKRDHVAATDVATHLALVDQARDLVEYELKQGAAADASGMSFGRAHNAMFALTLGAAALAIFYGRRRRRRVPTQVDAEVGAL